MSSASSLSDHNDDDNEGIMTEVYDDESPPPPPSAPPTPHSNNETPSSSKLILSSTMVDLDDTIIDGYTMDGQTIPTRPHLDKAGISQELAHALQQDENDVENDIEDTYYHDDATIATKSTFHRQGPTPIDMDDFLRRQQLEQLAQDPSYYHSNNNNNNNNNNNSMPPPQQPQDKTPSIPASGATVQPASAASATMGTSTSASPKNSQQQQQQQQRRKGYKWWGVVALLFVAVGVIIGLLVALVFNKDDADPNGAGGVGGANAGGSGVETSIPLPPFQVQLLTTVDPAELEGSGLLRTITTDHLATTMRPGILFFETIDLDMLVMERNHSTARQLLVQTETETVHSPLVTARFEGTLHLQPTATASPLPSRIQQLIQLAFSSGTKLDQYRTTMTDLGLEASAISVSNAASSEHGAAGTIIVFGCSPKSALLPGCNTNNNGSNAVRTIIHYEYPIVCYIKDSLECEMFII
eukprot:scaffold85962_cov43-Attheya_sp.AAC.3